MSWNEERKTIFPSDKRYRKDRFYPGCMVRISKSGKVRPHIKKEEKSQ